MVRRKLGHQQFDHAAMDDEREDRRREDGSARDEQPRAELLEMADELDFLTVCKTPGELHRSTPRSGGPRLT